MRFHGVTYHVNPHSHARPERRHKQRALRELSVQEASLCDGRSDQLTSKRVIYISRVNKNTLTLSDLKEPVSAARGREKGGRIASREDEGRNGERFRQQGQREDRAT